MKNWHFSAPFPWCDKFYEALINHHIMVTSSFSIYLFALFIYLRKHQYHIKMSLTKKYKIQKRELSDRFPTKIFWHLSKRLPYINYTAVDIISKHSHVHKSCFTRKFMRTSITKPKAGVYTRRPTIAPCTPYKGTGRLNADIQSNWKTSISHSTLHSAVNNINM
jgi:hypothetical protein